ncbi:MAG: Fur family transcriptional regulator [Candidatus Dormibacteria bacterium]
MKPAPSSASRSTRQKRALDGLLATRPGFGSAQELHAELRSRGEGVGLTTVYANLRALAEAGLVDTVRTEAGEVLYRRCQTGTHHHHVVCRVCGTTVEVEGPDVEDWAEAVAATAGYVDVHHTVEIVGTCPTCACAPAT